MYSYFNSEKFNDYIMEIPMAGSDKKLRYAYNVNTNWRDWIEPKPQQSLYWRNCTNSLDWYQQFVSVSEPPFSPFEKSWWKEATDSKKVSELLSAVWEEDRKEFNDIIEKVIAEEKDNMSIPKRSFITITKVEMPVEDKVLIVHFSDGTKEKVVCHENDTFDFETGLGLCILKKLYGGSGEYHKAMKKIIKKYDADQKKIEDEKAEKARIKVRREKNAQKKAERRKRAEERQIEIQKEAYLRALKESKND